MSRHARRTLSAATAVFTLAVLTTGTAQANFSGRNGQITFQRFDSRWQIWVADPDLSHQRQITSDPSDNAFPTWSPDGSRIAFQSDRTDPDPNDDVEIQDIFTMRPDGTDVRKITDSVGDSEKPSWSPDGRCCCSPRSRELPEHRASTGSGSDGLGAARQLDATSRRVTNGRNWPAIRPTGGGSSTLSTSRRLRRRTLTRTPTRAR
jgi:Tol biopolymer transport system component